MADFNDFERYIFSYHEVKYLGEMAGWRFPNWYGISVDNTAEHDKDLWEVKLLVPDANGTCWYSVNEYFQNFKVDERVKKHFPFDEDWLRKSFSIKPEKEDDFIWHLKTEDALRIMQECLQIKEPFAYKATRFLDRLRKKFGKPMLNPVE